MTLTGPKAASAARRNGSAPTAARPRTPRGGADGREETLLVRRRMLQALRRRADRMSQEQVADRMGISDRHYWNLECDGKPWSQELVLAFEKAVGLDPRRDRDQRHALWLNLLRYPPPPLPPAITEADRLVVDSLPYFAYISDSSWKVVYANAAMKKMFRGVDVGTNIMVYVMGAVGRSILVEWATRWVTPMLDQLNAAYVAASGTDPQLADELREVIDTVCQDPEVRHLWEQRATHYLAGPNGDLRRAILATGQEVTLLLWSGLLAGPNMRLLQLIPVDVKPDGTLDPIPHLSQTPPTANLDSAPQE